MWQGLKVKRFNVVFEVKQFVHSKKQRRHSVYCNCYFIPPFKLLNSPVLRKRWISWNQSGWLSWLSSSSSLLLLLLLLLWLLYEWNSVIQFYKYSIRSNGATVVSRCRVLFLLTLLAKMRMRCCRAPDMFLLSRMCVCVCCIWQNVCLGWVQLYELLNFIKYVEYKTLSLNFHVFCTMTMWVRAVTAVTWVLVVVVGVAVVVWWLLYARWFHFKICLWQLTPKQLNANYVEFQFFFFGLFVFLFGFWFLFVSLRSHWVHGMANKYASIFWRRYHTTHLVECV